MITFDQEDIAFANEVFSFARQHLGSNLRRKVASELRPDKAESVAWQKALWKRGWGAPAWPTQYGGCGWSLKRQYIFKRELGRAFAPDPSPFGLQMIGPVVYTFGSPEQKEQYLPSILSADTWWCQGFSEPNSGSDLASLTTQARVDGDRYVISGQKIWTSLAHWADKMFCLARTERSLKPQAGISMLVLDMHAPGVTVRPIITIDGHHHLNEVFLDNVRVPKANLIGEPGKGWTYAKFLLGNERIGIANIPRLRRRMDALRQLGAIEFGGGRPADDVSIRRAISEFEVDLVSLEQAELRALARGEENSSGIADASILKVQATELLQRGDALLARMLGARSAIMPSSESRVASDEGAMLWGIMPALLHGRASTIYGGSNEIQRNIIASGILDANG
jgi:alkylation response protein AidB-like acyl-CoA dehydrogenase